MKRSKTPQRNTPPKNATKKCTVWDEYLNLKSYERCVISDVTVEQWAQDMYTWINTQPYPRSVSEFYNSRGIARIDFYRLCNKFPILKEANAYALYQIGERRELGAIYDGLNWAAVKHRLYQYMPDFKEADIHHAQIKAEADKNSKQDDHGKVFIVDKMYKESIQYHEEPEPTKI